MEYLVDFFEPIFKMRVWTKLIRSIWDNQIPLFCSFQVCLAIKKYNFWQSKVQLLVRPLFHQ
ncbi:hypothetical protein ABB02_00318 [Clostridiaceae bacterium JG1575]|nr:hypothetical protein ABB02_00318 [Clostridiaceae bacterium JG1575]